jgi:hypothetical protein
MRCNWLLAYGNGRKNKRMFKGCFPTLQAAQKTADRLNVNCHNVVCWRPVFNPPPGVRLAGSSRRSHAGSY